MEKERLPKEEQETILMTSEAEDSWEVYTFNSSLKKRLRSFAARYPGECALVEENSELGWVTYRVSKSCCTSHLSPPQSEARRRAASARARMNSNFTTGAKSPKAS